MRVVFTNETKLPHGPLKDAFRVALRQLRDGFGREDKTGRADFVLRERPRARSWRYMVDPERRAVLYIPASMVETVSQQQMGRSMRDVLLHLVYPTRQSTASKWHTLPLDELSYSPMWEPPKPQIKPGLFDKLASARRRRQLALDRIKKHTSNLKRAETDLKKIDKRIARIEKQLHQPDTRYLSDEALAARRKLARQASA